MITNNLPDKANSIDQPDSSPSKVQTEYHRLAPANAKLISQEAAVVSGTSVELQFTFSLPKHCKLTEGVKSKWQCCVFDEAGESSEYSL